MVVVSVSHRARLWQRGDIVGSPLLLVFHPLPVVSSSLPYDETDYDYTENDGRLYEVGKDIVGGW